MTTLIDHESIKQKAALSSVVAACFLTGIKIVVGFMTGSLGILAEAAHSGLDLIAAVLTWFAVRASSRPADRVHPYGHGKIENLSALFETLLLLMTCFWIFHSAIERIITQKIEIEVTVWSYAVMIVSIFVDASRSRMLFAVARKYKSQALEADALHFSTDIWSSAVVILGLVFVSVSSIFPQYEFLRYADAIAAIIVALIVVQVSLRLGTNTVNALLDTAPEGVEDRIVACVEAVPGIINCHQVRVRAAGPQVFVDLHVLLDGRLSLTEAHKLTEKIEEAIKKIVPDADITVHPEPK